MKEARGRISQRAIKYMSLQRPENLIPASGEQQRPYLIKKSADSVCCVHLSVLTALSRLRMESEKSLIMITARAAVSVLRSAPSELLQ